MSETVRSDRAARLAELEFIALCKQHQAAKQKAVGVKNPRRTKPDFLFALSAPGPGVSTNAKVSAIPSSNGRISPGDGWH